MTRITDGLIGRQAEAAREGAHKPAGKKDTRDIAKFRKQIGEIVRELERGALAGKPASNERLDATRMLSAMVLVKYVAEYDLGHRAA